MEAEGPALFLVTCLSLGLQSEITLHEEKMHQMKGSGCKLVKPKGVFIEVV